MSLDVKATSDQPSVESHLLGAVNIPEEQSFTFPEGILGFPAARRFALVPDRREGLFWLQSLEHPALTFLLVDPFQRVEDYAVDFGDGDLRGLGSCAQEELAVLTIVTLPREPGQPPTANLQGPIVLDCGAMRGRQVVLADSSWGIRFPIDLCSPSRLAS